MKIEYGCDEDARRDRESSPVTFSPEASMLTTKLAVKLLKI